MTISLRRGARSIAGYPLKGERLTQFIFSDESGSSANEPVTVVASVIVDGDSKWRPLADEIERIKRDFVPLERRRGFVFHAVDLFSGKALGEDRKGSEVLKSQQALVEICKLVPRYDLPIALGMCGRLDHLFAESPSVLSQYPGISSLLSDPRRRCLMQVMLAFAAASAKASEYIEKFCPNQIAVSTYESNNEINEALKVLPEIMRASALGEIHPPIRAIASINVAGKDDESLLQIADACAFVCRRHLAGLSMPVRYLDALGIRNRLTALAALQVKFGAIVYLPSAHQVHQPDAVAE